MLRKFIHIIFWGVVIFHWQPLTAQNQKEEIQSLENDFKSFKYQMVLNKGRFLLAAPSVSHQDSLLIFQYMLNAAYALNDTSQARGIINDILKSEPHFSPDPQLTSPKIIEFFNEVKKNSPHYPQRPAVSEDTTKIIVVEPQVKASGVLSSVILPGSGHLFSNRRTKGILFSGISVALMGGIIYSVAEMTNRRDDYMNARGNVDYDDLYSKYNRAYKTRNWLVTAYGLYSLYVVYDLLHYHPPSKKTAIQLKYLDNKPMLGIQTSW